MLTTTVPSDQRVLCGKTSTWGLTLDQERVIDRAKLKRRLIKRLNIGIVGPDILFDLTLLSMLLAPER